MKYFDQDIMSRWKKSCPPARSKYFDFRRDSQQFRPMPAARSKKPWPMKWILLGVILFIVPYTYINLHFRKPGPGFLPYDDMREREHLGRGGFKRITARLSRPADPSLELGEGE